MTLTIAERSERLWRFFCEDRIIRGIWTGEQDGRIADAILSAIEQELRHV